MCFAFANNVKISKTKIIYISFTTLRRKISFDVDVFVAARAKSLSKLRAEIISHLPAPSFGSSTHANITSKFDIDMSVKFSLEHKYILL